MTTRILLLFSTLCVFLAACSDKKQSTKSTTTEAIITSDYADSIHTALSKQYNNGHLPGFAVSIFSKDSVYFTRGYGYADVENKTPYNEHTIQGIASISKTLVAMALMKAIEDDIVALDDDINTILPYDVSHPNHPETPITLRHLATHTSSINDDVNYNKAYIFDEKLDYDEFPAAWEDHITKYNANEPMSMAEFLRHNFGKWTAEETYLDHKPGTHYEYSNIAVALLAHCLELKLGKEFKDITQELILDPLGMKHSGWSYKMVEQDNQAVFYNEIYNIVPNYYAITYPDGGLYTTVHELTTYMQDIMQGYYGQGSLLQPESYTRMMTNQIPDVPTATGVIWDLDIACCIGHGGNDFGIATLAYFDPKSGLGKILFTNLSIEKEEQGDQFFLIFNEMFAYDNMIASANGNTDE